MFLHSKVGQGGWTWEFVCGFGSKFRPFYSRLVIISWLVYGYSSIEQINCEKMKFRKIRILLVGWWLRNYWSDLQNFKTSELVTTRGTFCIVAALAGISSFRVIRCQSFASQIREPQFADFRYFHAKFVYTWWKQSCRSRKVGY